MPLDLQDAAVRAIKCYFDEALPLLDTSFGPAVEGWPEWEESSAYNDSPYVSITPVQHTVSLGSPCAVASAVTADPNVCLNTYKLGYVTLQLQIDLWASYKEQLACLAPLVDCSFHNDLPFTSGLKVTLDDYYSAALTVFRIDRVERKPTLATAKLGEQRKTWRVQAHVDLLCQGTSPKQAVLRLTTTTTIGGQTIADVPKEVS